MSRFIQWGLGEPASHLAIETADWVYHSSIGGVRRMSHPEFWSAHTLARGVRIPATDDEGAALERELDRLVDKVDYDYGAFAYFAWRAALRKFLGIPFPIVNAGDRPAAMLCVELLYGFFEAYAKIVGRTITLRDKTFGVMTPLGCVAFATEAFGCDASPFSSLSG